MYMYPMVLSSVCMKEIYQKIKISLIAVNLKLKKYENIYFYLKQKVVLPNNTK